MYIHIKNIALFLCPFGFCLIFLFVGLILLWTSRRQKAGKIFITIGFASTVIFSLPFLPDFFHHHLERQHDTFVIDNNDSFNVKNIKYIVVLAGGHTLNSKLPITSQFTYSGLVRLIEGIRLFKKIPDSKLILSGGPGEDPITDAELMADLSIELGVDRNEIILETKSMNTYEEAIFIKPIVGDSNFLLVTSAVHMPRSMALFRSLQMNPIAAPTGHIVKHNRIEFLFRLRAYNLVICKFMIYEYLGLFKEKLSGNI